MDHLYCPYPRFPQLKLPDGRKVVLIPDPDGRVEWTEDVDERSILIVFYVRWPLKDGEEKEWYAAKYRTSEKETFQADQVSGLIRVKPEEKWKLLEDDATRGKKCQVKIK